MKVNRVGDLWSVSRMTGPTHNLLQLGVTVGGEGGGGEPVIEALEMAKSPYPQARPEVPRIRSEEVRAQVMDVVAWYSREFEVDIHVSRIRFVVSDSPSDTVYRLLTATILKHILDEQAPG